MPRGIPKAGFRKRKRKGQESVKDVKPHTSPVITSDEDEQVILNTSTQTTTTSPPTINTSNTVLYTIMDRKTAGDCHFCINQNYKSVLQLSPNGKKGNSVIICRRCLTKIYRLEIRALL